ncbi:hypothetical protein NL676_038230 [Syzygium grande]|nr:hypothetical protein NL676_038230 [Syzygium grande]
MESWREVDLLNRELLRVVESYCPRRSHRPCHRSPTPSPATVIPPLLPPMLRSLPRTVALPGLVMSPMRLPSASI